MEVWGGEVEERWRRWWFGCRGQLWDYRHDMVKPPSEESPVDFSPENSRIYLPRRRPALTSLAPALYSRDQQEAKQGQS